MCVCVCVCVFVFVYINTYVVVVYNLFIQKNLIVNKLFASDMAHK